MAISGARPCPACLQLDSRSVGAADGFEMALCRRCRTLFTAQLPTAMESLDYDAYYHAVNLKVPDFILERLGEVVASFEEYRQLGRWLDVGCGAGTLLQAARNRGWAVVGTEVSVGAAAAVRAEGFDVRVGALDTLDLPEAGFDVVSLIEVIEHVPDPRQLLSDAARLLRPHGALYLRTPHGRGLSARVLGTSWSVVAPPEHLQLFSLRGVRIALEVPGLVLRQARAQSVNPHELAAGLKRRVRSSAEGGDNVESGYRLNEALLSSGGGTLVKNVVNTLLAATRLGDSLRVVAERPG
jgi:SAM-dependent methyltransferase